MAQHGLEWIGRFVLLHPYLTYVIGFLAPIAGAYWLYSVAPYARGQTERLLSPWHVRRPAVPGVLERYASWEWVGESRLSPFGRWLFEELARQELTLPDLLRRADLEMQAVGPALFAEGEADPAVVRQLASMLNAEHEQIDRLLQAQRRTGYEMNRLR